MFLTAPEASTATEKLYKDDRDSLGFVMNLTRLWAWRPEIYEGFVALRAQLIRGSTLSQREVAILVCAGVSTMQCAYCSIAWGGKLAKLADDALAASVLDGTDERLTARESALAEWARAATRNPNATTADDVQALRAAGLSEKEIFEATCLLGFRIAFSTINDSLGAQPDAELAAGTPRAVREAVTYGRPVASPQR